MTLGYPSEFKCCDRKMLPNFLPANFPTSIVRGMVRTRPRSLTSYRNSYSGIGFHFSILAACTIFLASCSSVEIPDFKAHITLPASGDGYWVKTVSQEEGRIPHAQWDITRKRGIIILSEDWAILRSTILKNCLTMKCKQSVGAFDGLFYSIDEALKKLPPIKP